MRELGWGGVGAIVWIALSFPAPREARADRDLHAAATATAGFTNNVLGVSESVEADGTAVRADGFLALRPSLVFLQEEDRFVQLASYAINARMYVQETGASSYSGQLQWQSLIGLSPMSELSLSAGLTHGEIGNFGIAGAPSDTPTFIQPSGDVLFVSERFDESYALQLSRDWQLFQDAGVGAFHPIGQENGPGTSFEAGFGAELQRNFIQDAVAFGVRVDYLAARRDDLMPIPEERLHEIVAGPRLRWLRDLTDQISAQLGVGFAAVVLADDLEDPIIQPTALVLLSYVEDLGSVSLSYRHTIEPNLFIGETAATDVVALRGDLPIPNTQDWYASGTVAYRRSRFLNLVRGIDDGNTNLVVVDGEVTWEMRDDLLLSGRLQMFQQTFDRRIPTPISDINRVQLLISATVRFPPDAETRIPDRTRLRVDWQDRDPIGLGNSEQEQ